MFVRYQMGLTCLLSKTKKTVKNGCFSNSFLTFLCYQKKVSHYPRKCPRTVFFAVVWCSVYLYLTASLNKAETQGLRIADGY